MRISAWNIQNGGGTRIDGIVRALSDVGSDVCVLSEFTEASSMRLSTALRNVGFDYIFHTEPESRWGGVLVASRLSIRLGEIVDCPSPERWLHVVFEDEELEIGAAKIEREGELAAVASEILFELAHVRLHQARGIFEGKSVSLFLLLSLVLVLTTNIARAEANRLLSGQAGVEFQGD